MCAGDVDKEKGFLSRMQEVEEHLAITFHRFLQGELICMETTENMMISLE